MNKVKVSVIIPVYNPGEGFAKCLHSLQNQSLKDIEMIFVDDCDTEGTIKIIKKAAEKDGRIHYLINDRNIGSGRSRNRGIEAAKGEYLSFIDPDDYVAEDFLEKLYKKGESTDADIVKGVIIRVNDKGEKIDFGKRITLNESIRMGLESGRSLAFLFTYNHVTAIYRRKWILESGALYGSSSNAEDTTFLLRVCYGAPKIEFVDTAVYYYINRIGSADSRYSEAEMRGHMISMKEKMEFLTSRFSADPEMYRYININIKRMLKAQKGCALTSGMADTAEAFLIELREYIESFPFSKELGKEDRNVDVFLKYGCNIMLDNARGEWKEERFKDHLYTVTRVVDFICAHPELEKDYRDYLWSSFERAIVSKQNGDHKEKEKRRAALLKQAQRLPHKKTLTDDFIAMKLYIDYDVDVFSIRQTLLGRYAKRMLKKIRNHKNKT